MTDESEIYVMPAPYYDDPPLALEEDGTCGEWEGQGTCATSASSAV